MIPKFKFSKNIPELLFAVLTIVLIIGDGFSMPLAVVLGILSILIFSQNKILGIIFGTLTILVSLYMMGAVLSEFSEFPIKNKEAMTLLLVGMSIFGSTLVLSSLMLAKYLMHFRKIKL